MRDRKDIMEESRRHTNYPEEKYLQLNLEVLLDIRELMKNCGCREKS